jgi:NADH:ubiquinone reductase (H+-translocating)
MSQAPVPSARHRVVVVGGGFGGLPATRLLAHSPVDVTLIDRRNHHLFQPLLYQVATGILSPGQIAPVLRHLLRRHRNVSVEMAEVTGFDLERRVVLAAAMPGEQREYPYDSLIVAAGAGQSYFGHDEYAMIAPGMKTIDDALELRRRVYGAFELAECAPDETQRRYWLTIVLVGGGPTGVELAGQVRELAVRSLTRDFRRIDPAEVRVVLADGGAEPLAAFGDRLSGKAADALQKRGVELRMHSRVVGVDAFGVDVDGPDGRERITAGTVIWAAGVQASPLAGLLAEATGATTDRSGRIAVLPDLSLPGHPEVFAVGDMATIDKLPGVCEVAMQGGLHAANTIRRRLKDGAAEARPFRYRDLGSAAAIGRFSAIVNFKGMRLSGFAGFLVWMFVHLTFLNGFGNRLGALWRWGRAMAGRARPERVFSMGHTGGDLSLPEEVRRRVMPSPFPVFDALPKQPGTSPFDALPRAAAGPGPDGAEQAPARTQG